VRNKVLMSEESIDFTSSEIINECKKLQSIADPTHSISQMLDWRNYKSENTRDRLCS
jgi:hypothetical protein